MNAPIIWILVPILIAILAEVLRSNELIPRYLSTLACVLLAAFAVVLPVGDVVQLGPLVLDFPATFDVLGRRFILSSSDQPLLTLIYSLGAFWFLGAGPARVTSRIYSYGLAMIALLVASLAVEPFLYSALLVEMAVLVSVPMLIEVERQPGQGLLRYLIFQTLGMPFILLAGWVLGSVEISPSREMLLQQAALLLGLGFAFWLAVFPFYSWMPLLADETSPYLAGFLFSLLPTVVLFLALDFLNGFTWLRGNEALYDILQLTGVIMVVTGGFVAAFQQDLSRLFGYAVIAESGFALLALSTNSLDGMQVFATAFLPRLLTLGLLALALTTFRNNGIPLRLATLGGMMQRMPFASIALTLACLSFGGLPLLASFPVRQGLFEALASADPLIALWALAGSAGFLFTGFRLLFVLVWSEHRQFEVQENRMQRLFLSGGTLGMLVIGWFPASALVGLLQLLRAFPNLH